MHRAAGRRRRSAAVGVLGLLAGAVVTMGSSITSAQAAGRTVDVASGSAYLVDPARLLHGHYYEAFPGSGSADWGLIIDTGLALIATHEQTAALGRLRTFIEHGKDGAGTTITDWTGIGTPYLSGGSVAKEALFAQALGADPRDFGGHDLIAALNGAVCRSASKEPDTSCAGRGNYLYATSVFSQALGVMAQSRAGQPVGAPVTYLRGLQASDGSFPSLIPSSRDRDVDSTAMAAMALDVISGQRAVVDRAVAWIAGRQLADGGFTGTAGESTNTAALAIQALSLRSSTYAGQLARARTFLAGQQNADGGFNISPQERGSDVRASAQAVGGSTGISFAVLRAGSPAPPPSRTPPPTSPPATSPPATSPPSPAPASASSAPPPRASASTPAPSTSSPTEPAPDPDPALGGGTLTSGEDPGTDAVTESASAQPTGRPSGRPSPTPNVYDQALANATPFPVAAPSTATPVPTDPVLAKAAATGAAVNPVWWAVLGLGIPTFGLLLWLLSRRFGWRPWRPAR
jgi:energy-converting hydrogenase Eha subunit B